MAVTRAPPGSRPPAQPKATRLRPPAANPAQRGPAPARRYVFMFLLALQFGWQPFLTARFTPKETVKTVVVRSILRRGPCSVPIAIPSLFQLEPAKRPLTRSQVLACELLKAALAWCLLVSSPGGLAASLSGWTLRGCLQARGRTTTFALQWDFGYGARIRTERVVSEHT